MDTLVLSSRLWTLHDLGICPPICGRLCCFQVLAATGEAAMDIAKYLIHKHPSPLLLGRGLWVESQDQMAEWRLDFLIRGQAASLSQTLLPAGAPVLVPSHPLPTLALKSRPSYGYIVTSHCDFNVLFPNNLCCWTYFHKCIYYQYVFFRQISIQILGRFSLFSPFVFDTGRWTPGHLTTDPHSQPSFYFVFDFETGSH